ncbi:MAG: hypothetical protein MI810_21670 [Flavobacteriales bacterium]|nr:hypothetical protein [Flavobacteriales bacterium]
MKNLFHIPEPCHEKWTDMTPTEKGAFCQKCSKEVLDLRNLPIPIVENSVLRSANPCVRISKDTLSELNFRHWVKSLNLIRQLRYAFVFALVLNFGTAIAQTEDTSIFNPDTMLVDTVKQGGQISYKWEVPDSCATPNIPDSSFYHIGYPIIIEDIQGGMPPPIYPIEIIDWDDIVWITTDTHTWETLVVYPEDKPHEALLAIHGNEYHFLIEEDELVFTIKAAHSHKVKLHVESAPSEDDERVETDKFYFPPLFINEGEKVIRLPLDKFEKGNYCIHLKTTRGNGVSNILF